MSTSSLGSRSLIGGNPWATLWHLSWPLVLTMVFNSAVGLLDTWIAGRISPVSQAAVGLTMQLILLINAATTATSIGCQALVARFIGADNWEEAGKAAQQSLLVGLWVSLSLAMPVWFFAPGLFSLMGAEAAVIETGTHYVRLLVPGLVAMGLGILLQAIFRARGQTIDLMISNGVESSVWIAGSVGLGLLAGWGLNGLAAGFVAGRFAGLFTAWLLFKRSDLFTHLPSPWRTDWGWAKRILNIGLPAGAQVLIRNAGMICYFAILNMLAHPTEAVAAFSIGFRIESIAFLPVFALNIAASTMVGQNLGAGRPDEAAAMGWRIAGVAVALMAAFGVFFYTQADALAAVFTDNALVRAYTADYLRIIALSEPFLGAAMVLNGAFQGAGEARVPMFMTLLMQVILRLPLAWGLAIGAGLGPTGAWWAITASMWLQGLVIVYLFSRGRWKDRRI